MATITPLELTHEQRRILGDVADTYRWAKGARHDHVAEAQLGKARYFIWGAAGLNCEDDAEIARVLGEIYDDRGVLEIAI